MVNSNKKIDFDDLYEDTNDGPDETDKKPSE